MRLAGGPNLILLQELLLMEEQQGMSGGEGELHSLADSLPGKA